jgi:hypothetical protein
VEFKEDKVSKVRGTGELAPLVGTDATTVFVAVVVEKLADNVQRWVFGGREKDPDISSGFINNEEVGCETVIQSNYPLLTLLRMGIFQI